MGNFSCLSESDRAPTMRLAVRAYPWIQAGQSGFPVRIRWTFRTCLLESKMKKFVAKTIRYYKLSFVQLYQMNRLWGLATAPLFFTGLSPDALTVCEHPSWIVFAHRIRSGLFFTWITKNRLWRRFFVQSAIFTLHLAVAGQNAHKLLVSRSALWVYVADSPAGSDKARVHPR